VRDQQISTKRLAIRGCWTVLSEREGLAEGLADSEGEGNICEWEVSGGCFSNNMF
jgi:hypothetical protein